MKLFTWNVGVANHATSGFAPSYEEATTRIKNYVDQYKALNVEVVHYSVEDPSGEILLSMDIT